LTPASTFGLSWRGRSGHPNAKWKTASGLGGNVGTLLRLSRAIDAVNFRIGKILSWLVVVAILVSAINATSRKLFNESSNAWLELQWVLFSAVFLLCSPWTLLSNEHIRIDIVNSMFPKRLRDGIDVFGHLLFLLPLTIVMMVTSLPFFLDSFNIREQSMNAGGLAQWPAKALIFICFFLLFLQGISELIKRIAVMRGEIPDPYGTPRSAAEMEAEQFTATLKPESHVD
jgi:TRAP-type mannitol/chloroaromatic compound transport system permease small subunit